MSFPILFCPSMWKSVHIDTDGYLTPCCIHVHGDDKKTRIEDVDHIETVLFNDHENWRQMLTRGEWPDGCNQCKFAEEEGRASKRLQDLQGLNNPTDEVSLEYLQLKTGRLCNLKCTICCPACSSSIANDLLKKGEIEQSLFDKYQNENMWSTDLKQYQKMSSKEGYYRIDIAGGEPLMNKTHFDWLDTLPNPENIQLLYNTNGTVKPTEEQIKVWEKFKGLWMTFSIDSIGEKFEQLRVGAKWDKVFANLKYFQEEIIDKRFNKYTSNTSIVMTIHEANVMDVFSLYKTLMDNIKFTHPECINFNYLYYPEHLAVHNMSKDRLEETIKIYEDNIQSLPKGSKILRESIKLKDSMITFLGDKKIEHNRAIGNDHRNKG
jgi:radical SAM protein with 4Fe4S-binding SPASM domain